MSSININHVVLTGWLTSDPELHALPSGSSVCNLRVAVNTSRRDPNGEWGAKPNYFKVVVFGASAENVARYMYKGRPIAVDGRLDWRAWETADGRNATEVSIIAKTVQFLGSAPSNGNGVGGDVVAALEAIDGSDEELLDVEDLEAIAMAAAEG
jgi:single-strand DNA-binding protein